MDLKWHIENLEVVKCIMDREKTSIVGIVAPTSGSGSFILDLAPAYSPPSPSVARDGTANSSTFSLSDHATQRLPPELVIALEPLNVTFSYHDLRLAHAIAAQLSSVAFILSSTPASSASPDFPWPIVCSNLLL